MPLVIFKRARNVGVLLENIERSIIRENVVTAEFVVGSDVEEQVGSPLPPYNTPSGLSKASLEAFQVADIMNFPERHFQTSIQHRQSNAGLAQPKYKKFGREAFELRHRFAEEVFEFRNGAITVYAALVAWSCSGAMCSIRLGTGDSPK